MSNLIKCGCDSELFRLVDSADDYHDGYAECARCRAFLVSITLIDDTVNETIGEKEN